MDVNASLKNTLILCSDKEDHEDQIKKFKNKGVNIKAISLNSIQDITPLYIKEDNGVVIYPHIKILEEEIDKVKQEILEDVNVNALSEYIIDIKLKTNENLNTGNTDGLYKILKPKNNDEERRIIDKTNLYKGFFTTFNHQNNIELDEQEDDIELLFKNGNETLSDLLDIEL
jgi:hypothetical protein